MILKIRIPFVFSFIFLSAFGGFAQAAEDEVYQISTIGALMQGLYEGSTTCGELKKKGDFGIGTFEGLDGELIQTEGKFYRVKTDGAAYLVEDSEKVPFAVSTFFKPEKTITLPPGMDYAGMQAYLDSVLPAKNRIHAVRISGEFSAIKTRSVPKYEKPYPLLSEAVKNQKVFELRDIRGTLIGFRFPAYLEGVNIAGYHFHFLAENQKAGGHVLDFRAGPLDADIDEAHSFVLEFPESEEFGRVDLTGTAEAIEAVERGKK